MRQLIVKSTDKNQIGKVLKSSDHQCEDAEHEVQFSGSGALDFKDPL